MRSYRHASEWQLAADPGTLWPLITDSTWFDPPGAHGASEESCEWVHARACAVARDYSAGPLRRLLARVELEPRAGGTRVRCAVEATPRNAALRFLLPVLIRVLVHRRFAALFPDHAIHVQHAADGHAAPALPLRGRSHVTAAASRRLDALGEQLRAGPRGAPHWDRLRAVLERAGDGVVGRLRPYELAQLWGVRRRDVLRLCLDAVRAGALRLRWDLRCPFCRGSCAQAETLRELALHAHCARCQCAVEADFDHAVELAFRAAPAVRAVARARGRADEPRHTPHILVQQLLRPGERRVVAIALDEATHRVRCAGRADVYLFDVVQGGAPRTTLSLGDGGWTGSAPAVAAAAQLELHNDSAQSRLFLVEHAAPRDDAAVAADVFALQEFRDRFPGETLRAGARLRSGGCTVLFTGLRESVLYDSAGGAPALARVLDHLGVLRRALEREDGAIVKTMGDALMAVFQQPAGAVRAILRAHEHLAASMEGIQPVQLKAGVHHGACDAVTLDDRLDYVGSAVDTAARFRSAAHGGDIVVSDVVLRDPAVTALVRNLALNVTTEEMPLEGCSTPLRCHRLRAARVRWSRC